MVGSADGTVVGGTVVVAGFVVVVVVAGAVVVSGIGVVATTVADAAALDAVLAAV